MSEWKRSRKVAICYVMFPGSEIKSIWGVAQVPLAPEPVLGPKQAHLSPNTNDSFQSIDGLICDKTRREKMLIVKYNTRNYSQRAVSTNSSYC